MRVMLTIDQGFSELNLSQEFKLVKTCDGSGLCNGFSGLVRGDIDTLSGRCQRRTTCLDCRAGRKSYIFFPDPDELVVIYAVVDILGVVL